MKHLSEYVFENLQDHTVFLIKTYEDALTFFKRSIKPNYTIQDDINVSDEQFKALYNYCNTNNMPAPIVGCYGNTKYGFAFRRWFNENIQKNIKDEHDYSFYSVFNRSSKYFKNYHNTALKEDGKFVPSAQDFEELICFAYNKLYNIFDSDDKNCDAVGISKNKRNNIIQYYKLNSEILDNIANVLHKQCPCSEGYGKLKNTTGKKITDEWAKYYTTEYSGRDSKPNATPKTDIYSLDNDHTYCLSLKEAGGSQLMSAKINEAKATLLFACESLEDENEQKEILPILAGLLNVNETDKKRIENTEEIFDEFGPDDLQGKTLREVMNDESNEVAKRIKASKEKGKNFEKQLNDLIILKHPKYKEALYKEAMTGLHKFIAKSFCRANHVFVWDDVNINNNNIFTIDEYYKHIENKSKVSVDFKSWPSSNVSGQTLKIITK